MSTQPHTLHLDLSGFSPDLEFRLLNGVKGGVPLSRYADAPSKLDEHRATNPALALIPEEHTVRVTHFLENVHLPTRGVSQRQIVFPSLDDHPLSELAMIFTNIGEDDVMRALSSHPAYQDRGPHHLALATYGVDHEETLANYAEVHLAANDIKPPGVTAQNIVRYHPDIGTVNGAVTKYVLDTYLSSGMAFSQLVQYIQTNGPGTDNQWYNKSWTMWSQNPDGTGPLVPAKANTDLVYKDRGEPDWPTPPGGSAPGLPTYVLTDEHDPPAKTGKGAGVIGAAGPVVKEVLRRTQADHLLNGLLWSKQDGTTERTTTNTPAVRVTPPAPAPMTGPAAEAAGASDKARGFALKNVTSTYGLWLYDQDMTFDPNAKTLSLPVLNWPSRYLGAYVRFRRSDGTVIKRSEIKAANPKDPGKPFTWTDRLPIEIVRSFVEPSDTKNYLTWISSGNAIFGIPTFEVFTQKTVLDFLWPDDATRAELLLGGLGFASGFADWDSDVDIVGVLGTALVNYGVGVIMLVAGVYVINPFLKALQGDAKIAFYIVCGFLGAAAAAGSGAAYQTGTAKTILNQLSGIAAGIVFGQIMDRAIEAGARKAIQLLLGASAELVAELTAEEAIEAVPFAGWAMKVVAIAADLAALAATTIQCILSPATYELDVLRTMDLTVTVGPDPKHGTEGFNPVWPLVSDHFRIQVAYPSGAGQSGGTTYTKSGPMPGEHDQEITVVFEGIPAGGKIDVSANIYSSTDWLCGRWESGWINAVPDANAKLATAGSITEFLVPLTSATTYSQKQTIAYSSQGKHHWLITRFSVEANLTADLDKGGTPSSAVVAAFTANGNAIGSGASITVEEAGRRWTLLAPGVSYAVAAQQIVSVKAFDLQLATYRADLDKGGPTPASLESAFATNKVPLPAGTAITVVAAGSRWIIARPGQLPLFAIDASGDTAVVTKVQWQLTVQNTTNPAPPLPAVYPLPAGPTGNQLGAFQSIVHNNTEYALGYAWMAAGQNLPLDDGDQPQNVPMYAMQSISTLGQPQDQIIEPTRGFSLPTFLAYDQFGLTELFPLDQSFAARLVNGPVPKDVSDEFTAFGRPLPPSAQVAVVTGGREWQIGPSGGTPLYQLRLVSPDGKSSHIAVYSYPVPGLDNFYLDPRDHTAANPVYYLRGVDLHRPPGQYAFDYDKSKAWGRILNEGSLQGLTVHPHGYVVAVDYVNHKLFVLKLPAEATDSDKAPFAMPLAGEGLREGLMMNPQALTISADGRILILEEGNRRIQAFDVMGNPVPCFSVEQPSFSVAKAFATELDNHQASTALVQAFQTNTMPALAPKCFLPTRTSKVTAAEVAASLDAGTMHAALIKELLNIGYATADDTPANFSITTTTAGKLWLVSNTRTQARFDVRLLPDKYDIDHVYVFNAPALAVTLRSKGLDWLIEDTTNSTRYEVTAPGSGGDLKVQQLVSYMPLRDSQLPGLAYLDVATEPKGYIYVLMVSQTQGPPTFLLDIYNPDGSVLLDKPQSGVNAARLTVDQWRSMFTLNYNVVLGPNARTEPGVSQWQPSTPRPA